MAYPGTIIGNPSYVAATTGFNQALSVAGDNSGVQLPVPGPLDFASGAPFTIEVRIKTTGTGLQVIAGRFDTGGTDFYLDTQGNNIEFACGGSVVGAGTVIDGNWHSIAGSFDGTTARVFIDGILKGSSAVTFVGSTTTGTAYIGRHSSTSYPFNGQLDELRISNACLYTANYTPASAPFANAGTSGLRTLYHLDGPVGTAAAGSLATDSASVTTTATALAIAPSLATATVGAAQSFAISPNGSYTGTVSLTTTGTGGSPSPSSLSFAGSSVAQTVTLTPAGTGAATLTASTSPSLGANPTATIIINPPGGTLNIGCIGDSITAGYGLSTPSTQAPCVQMAGYLGKLGGLRTVNVVNQGQSGTSTDYWVPGYVYLHPAEAAFVTAFGAPSSSNPVYVYIRLGTNDAKSDGNGQTPAQYKANFTAILNDLTTAGYTPILAFPTYMNNPSGAWDLGTNARLATFCAILQGFIGTTINGIKVLAGDSLGFTFFNGLTSEQQDGVHPNAQGAMDLGLLDATAVYNALSKSGTTGAVNIVVTTSRSGSFNF